MLAWALDEFAPGVCLATAFGPQTIVLVDLVAELRPETTVFYLDTGLLFPETLQVRDELERRLGLRFVRVAPDLTVSDQARVHGEALWSRDPDRCCELRKVDPLARFLAGRPAWITGLRRGHSPTRAAVRVVEWDEAHGLIKVNPLAAWTDADVWARIRERDLPYNPLHDAGYPSIGCRPCTAAVSPGEPARSGRWAGRGKTECGIHLPPRRSDVTSPGARGRRPPGRDSTP